MGLAGEGQGQQSAAVEAVLETNHGGTFGKGARDLDGVFDGLRTGVEQDGLLGRVAGREFVELFRQRDVAFVRRDHKAGVEETIHLIMQGFRYAGIPVAHVEAADAAG